MIRAGYSRSTAARWRAIDSHLAAEPVVPHVYGGSRTSWPVIAAIVGSHLLAAYLVVALDMIHVVDHKSVPTVVRLIPELTPPPPPPSAPKHAPAKTIQPTLAPPIAVVQTPAPTPLAMPAVPTPPIVAPEPAPVAVAPPAPPKPAAFDATAATITGEPPSYPIESRRKHEQGTVVLRVLIGTDGRPDDVTVAQSSGYDRLDKAALTAVRKWRFRAPMRDGQPVQGLGTLAIPFELQG